MTYTSRHEIHSDATDSDTTQQASNYEVTLNDRVPVFYTRPHGTLAGTLDAVFDGTFTERLLTSKPHRPTVTDQRI